MEVVRNIRGVVLTKHAKERALERYNIKLTNQDIRNMVAMIQNQEYIKTRKFSKTRTVFLLFYKGIEIPVLYRKGGKGTIVTILETYD